MNRKLTVVGIIVLILGFSIGLTIFIIKHKKSPSNNLQSGYKRFVKARNVEYENLPALIETSGRLLSNNEVVITSSVSGRLEGNSSFFKSGQAFRKGDLLATIVDDEFLYSHYAKKSKFLQTLASMLPDMKIDLPGSFDNWNVFFQSVDVKTLLPSLPSIGDSKERIYLSSRSVLSDYYTLKSEEAKLDKYYIRAPFNGTIREVNQQIGAYVNIGTRLAQISMVDKYEIEVPVSTSEISFVQINQKVEVLNEDGNPRWTGHVSRISDVVNNSTQSISVFCTINGNDNLFDGKYHQVIIQGKDVENVMAIPRNALYNGNEVYLVKNGSAVKDTVIILKLNSKTAYINGLQEGDELVVEPLVNLGDNSNFEIIR
ncbi:MAG: efflux RND transporter periplasmic adaptor subunit [Marinilabiliaceae bacterium]|nr:efflux RND transporter periplasmic adaptor subunit [Marinilabiliaceae bacterium]